MGRRRGQAPHLAPASSSPPPPRRRGHRSLKLPPLIKKKQLRMTSLSASSLDPPPRPRVLEESITPRARPQYAEGQSGAEAPARRPAVPNPAIRPGSGRAAAAMDMIYSIACVLSSDGMDDDALSSNLPRPFLKASAAAIAAASIRVVPGGGRGASGAGAAGGIPGPLIPPATSVHELLECPVCTNSMYPPIHQVLQVIETHFEQRIIRDIKFYLRSWVVRGAR